jgi:hypothetical protein
VVTATVTAGLAAAPGMARSSPESKIERACGSFFAAQFAPAKAAHGVVPQSAIAPFAVLRRPQAPSDVPPPGADASGIADGLQGSVRVYDPALTRLVGQFGSTTVYLAVGIQVLPTPSRRCARVLPALEKRVLRLDREIEPPGPTYCFVTVSATATTTDHCLSSIWLDTGFLVDNVGTPPNGHEYAGLVPDGVGAVRLTYSKAAASVTAPVQGNTFLVADAAAPNSTANLRTKNRAKLRRLVLGLLPASVSWLAAPGGPVTRTFAPPLRLIDDIVDVLAVVVKPGGASSSGSGTSVGS